MEPASSLRMTRPTTASYSLRSSCCQCSWRSCCCLHFPMERLAQKPFVWGQQRVWLVVPPNRWRYWAHRPLRRHPYDQHNWWSLSLWCPSCSLLCCCCHCHRSSGLPAPMIHHHRWRPLVESHRRRYAAAIGHRSGGYFPTVRWWNASIAVHFCICLTPTIESETNCLSN